jgi:ribonuclease E
MRSVESLSLSIIRLAEEHAMKENTAQVLVQAPPEIANYLLNEKRRALVEIETRHDAPIIIVADDQLETPHFNVSRLREGETGEETAKPSYHRTSPRKLEVHALTKSHLNVPDLPAVTAIAPMQPAPVREPREELPESVAPIRDPAPMPRSLAPAPKPGLFGWVKSLFGAGAAETRAPAANDRGPREPREDRGNGQRSERNERGGRGGDRDRNRGRGGAKGEGRGQQQGQGNRQPKQEAPGGNRQQPQAQQQKPRNEARPERTEEQKAADEARKLEQQRKEAERREAQRQENIKREADRRAAREARSPHRRRRVTPRPSRCRVRLVLPSRPSLAAAPMALRSLT